MLRTYPIALLAALSTEEKIWDLTQQMLVASITENMLTSLLILIIISFFFSNVKGVWWGCKVGNLTTTFCMIHEADIVAQQYAIIAMRNNPEDPSKGLRKGGSIINTASFGVSYSLGVSHKWPTILTNATACISTVASMGAATPQIAYTASKGAVLAMTREMAMVHAREGIRINALSP